MLKTAIAFTAALGCIAPAAAQPSVLADNPGRFDQLDRNRDGFLTRDESKDAEELHTRFTELDRNNDNRLSREEYDVLKTERSAASGATGADDKAGAGTKGIAKGKTK